MVDVSHLRSISLEIPYRGEVSLPFFERRSSNGGSAQVAKSAVVFGKNGSGKSSIARCLTNSSAEFMDAGGRPVGGSDDTSNVFVFSDTYVDSNFRQVDSESLQPIVLLGAAAEQAEIEAELERDLQICSGKVKKTLDRLAAVEENLSKADGNIKKALRGDAKSGDGSWKGRTRKYHPEGQFYNLTQKIIDNIVGVSRSLDDTNDAKIEKVRDEGRFKELISRLEQVQGAQAISWAADAISIPEEVAEYATLFRDVDGLVDQERNSLTDLDSRVHSLGVSAAELRERMAGLLGEGSQWCPTCLQDIPSAHAELARVAIAKYLTELEKDSAVAQLRSVSLADVILSDPPEGLVGGGLAVAEYLEARTSLQEVTRKFNETLAVKADNPSATIALCDHELDGAYRRMVAASDGLEVAVAAHNKICDTQGDIRKEAAALNERLAAYEIHDWVVELDSYQRDLDGLREKREGLVKSQSEAAAALSKLRDARRSERRAAVAVNRLLRKVFGVSSMSLEPRQEGYAVLNRGQNVPPKWLSTGERNILSLCYFLVSISDGREFDTAFEADQLIVLDDPVSSFDHENRYGVISLLCWLGVKIGSKGSRTKLLVLTHDPSVAYELSKGLSSTVGSHFDWRLDVDGLSAADHAHIDFYRENLEKMARFALTEVGTSSVDELFQEFQPNAMRRVWEAFVTFELGGNVSDVTRSPSVIKSFEAMGEEYVEFLNSYPGRVFVHVDSHAATQMRYGDFGLDPSLGADDYRRFAREMLTFMHLMSPRHIPSRLDQAFDGWDSCFEKMQTLAEEVVESAVDGALV